MKIAGKIALIMSAAVVNFCLFAGCGGTEPVAEESEIKQENSTEEAGAEDQVEEAENVETEETETDKGYVFVCNGVEIVVDTDMNDVVEQLGEPNSYFEEPSCAAQGIAKIYTYSSFQIETYPDGDRDLIACIILKDDNVATPEGIDLSMTKDDILAAYGSDYEATETSMVYEKNGTKLCFILDGDSIASIEYDSPILN